MNKISQSHPSLKAPKVHQSLPSSPPTLWLYSISFYQHRKKGPSFCHWRHISGTGQRMWCTICTLWCTICTMCTKKVPAFAIGGTYQAALGSGCGVRQFNSSPRSSSGFPSRPVCSSLRGVNTFAHTKNHPAWCTSTLCTRPVWRVGNRHEAYPPRPLL